MTKAIWRHDPHATRPRANGARSPCATQPQTVRDRSATRMLTDGGLPPAHPRLDRSASPNLAGGFQELRAALGPLVAHGASAMRSGLRGAHAGGKQEELDLDVRANVM